MGRRGGPLGPAAGLLLCLLALTGWCSSPAGMTVSAARLPLHHGGRLGPGPSVEDDNPLPPSGHAATPASAHAANQQRRCAALPTRVLRQVLGPAYNPAYMAFSLEDSQGGGFGPFQSDGLRGALRGQDPRDPRGAEALDDGGQQYSSRVLKESPWTNDMVDAISPFAVDEDFRMVLSDVPAWQTRYEMPTVMEGATHYSYPSSSRRTRDADEPVEVVEAADESSEGNARAQRAAWGSSVPFAANKDMQWHCESPLRWVDLGHDYFPRFLRSADCGHPKCTGAGFVCRPRSFSVKVLRRREGVCAPAGDLPFEESTVGLPSDLRDLWVWELRAVNFCCVCSLRI